MANERDRENARRNRQEIINAKLSRRDMIKLGLITTGGMLIAKDGLSVRATNSIGIQSGGTTSPALKPFKDPFRRLNVARPVSEITSDRCFADGPGPSEGCQPQLGDGRTRDHQRWNEFGPSGDYTQWNGKFYEIYQEEVKLKLHSDLNEDTFWGFRDSSLSKATVPGHVYHAKYGEPILVRNHNNLPCVAEHVGYGDPRVTTHMHNGHTASESDGFPGDFHGRLNNTQPKSWYDHLYPNIRAGYDTFDGTYETGGQRGDVRETMSTLWYHDHRLDFTSQNVYRGLFGMYLLFSPQDNGDEESTDPRSFRLPSGEFDIPMMFHDRVLDSSGKSYFDLFNLDGIIGDKFTVNGVIQPFLEVKPRRYRFRLHNAGPSRFYELFLTDLLNLSKALPFHQISNDGNLLPNPVQVTSVKLGVAERMDVIIDFRSLAGKTIYIENRMEQTSGRGPTGKTFSAGKGNLIMQIKVAAGTVNDPSRDMNQALAEAKISGRPVFFALPDFMKGDGTLNRAVMTRQFRLDRLNGQWTINERPFDLSTVSATPKRGTCEIWLVQNNSNSWQHPVHIHFEEFQILTRNGIAPPITEVARKDVVRVQGGEQVRFRMQFREWTGRYPLHCHNVVHEDHAMMIRWDLQP